VRRARTRTRECGGVMISYGIVEGPLGLLLLGATARGLCWLGLGDDGAALLAMEHTFIRR